MSIAQVVAQNLQALRRYARALTGSQSSGDAYVTATLELISSIPDIVRERNPKLALFHSFARIWNSLTINTVPEPILLGARGDRRIAQLTSKPRQAFLLVSLEGFAEADAAEILDVSLGELRSLLEEAGRELAAEIATDVLIIEDEPLVALDLEGLVESLGHHVVGIARTHAETLPIAKARSPGLILADIQLGDGSSGVEAVSELLKEVCVPVVFITAHPARLLTGRPLEPVFVISKPFQTATVAAVISQALFFECNASHMNGAGKAIHQKDVQPSFFLQLLNVPHAAH